jgi:hypothetical protein
MYTFEMVFEYLVPSFPLLSLLLHPSIEPPRPYLAV